MTQQDIERLALRLLEVDSTSGREQEYAALLEAEFRERGYEVERQEVVDGRFNLAVNARGKSVLFNTHLDTVPPYIPPQFDETTIFGRGACDTKGILACMIAAGEQLRAEGIDDFGYLLVVGEEVDGVGARKANEEFRTRTVIVGEPTERKLALGHKGVAKFAVHVEGVAGHSAYPDTGRSAIHLLHDLLGELLDHDFGRDEVLGDSTLNIGRIEGGRAANVIADAAWAECLLRTVVSRERIQREVEQLIGARGRVVWTSLKDPARMRAVEGFPTTVVNFSSDIPYMPDIGEAILYGPGSILDAHTANEHIERADLALAAADYARMVKTLLAEA